MRAAAKKPFNERHPIVRWYHHLCLHQRKFVTSPGEVNTVLMIGAAAAYLGLSDDLYCLEQNAELQKILIARLRNIDGFPGAFTRRSSRRRWFVPALFLSSKMNGTAVARTANLQPLRKSQAASFQWKPNIVNLRRFQIPRRDGSRWVSDFTRRFTNRPIMTALFSLTLTCLTSQLTSKFPAFLRRGRRHFAD